MKSLALGRSIGLLGRENGVDSAAGLGAAVDRSGRGQTGLERRERRWGVTAGTGKHFKDGIDT